MSAVRRVRVYADGLNLFHALDELGEPHVKAAAPAGADADRRIRLRYQSRF